MEQEKILDDISNLPPKAQQQVLDFIDFLRKRYRSSQDVKQTRQTSLVKESFIGMWKDREDMKDSRVWLRNVRESEWSG